MGNKKYMEGVQLLDIEKEELAHMLDHILSDLDFEPWEEYKDDLAFMKEKIGAAVSQILAVRNKLLEECGG